MVIARPPVRSLSATRWPSPSKRSSTPWWTSPSRCMRSPAPTASIRSIVPCSSTPARTRCCTYSRSRSSSTTDSIPRSSSSRPSISPAGPPPTIATWVRIGQRLRYCSYRAQEFGMRTHAEITSLSDAVGELVHDGDTVALEGFTHLIPMAAGHEIIRAKKRDLTLVRMTPDIVYDQLIGAGCARKLIFSWGGNPGVGSLHRFREAVQKGELEIEEHSHAGMANRYVAAASGLPFAVLRGYIGTSLPEHTDTIKPITCPFTGESLTAVPALDLDVGIIHAQRADRQGNVQLWGQTGVQKETVLGARRSIVTVEELVDELDPKPYAVVLPRWVVKRVCEVPGGAKASYANAYYDRDNAAYKAWDEVSRDREQFDAWLGTL